MPNNRAQLVVTFEVFSVLTHSCGRLGVFSTAVRRAWTAGADLAGLRGIRLARPGDPLDPTGPVPQWTIKALDELPHVLAAA
jgi:hypothetical protein